MREILPQDLIFVRETKNSILTLFARLRIPLVSLSEWIFYRKNFLKRLIETVRILLLMLNILENLLCISNKLSVK